MPRGDEGDATEVDQEMLPLPHAPQVHTSIVSRVVVDDAESDVRDPIPPHLRRLFDRLAQPSPPSPLISPVTTLVQQASQSPHSESLQTFRTSFESQMHFDGIIQVRMFDPNAPLEI